jgi:hypothetical protein
VTSPTRRCGCAIGPGIPARSRTNTGSFNSATPSLPGRRPD